MYNNISSTLSAYIHCSTCSLCYTEYNLIIYKMSREFDLVLLGPTGYTGQYTAENIYKSFPTTIKWAVAGRSHSKIESLVQKWQQLGYDRPDPGIYRFPVFFECVLTSSW